LQTDEDIVLKACILDLACHGELAIARLRHIEDKNILRELQVMQSDGIVHLTAEKVVITNAGKAFIRNICSVFDKRMKKALPGPRQVFSKAI
jgi:oxygen-independent coproporphyrinogen-3 oxidase